MTIARVNAGGWAFGTKLTAAQGNQLDINTTYALDKRISQTDTLQSVVTAANGGRIVEGYAVGSNATQTVSASSVRALVCTNFSSTNKTYTLSPTGAVQGDVITIRKTNTNYICIVVDGASSSTLASIGGLNTVNPAWYTFVFNGTNWAVLCEGPSSGLTPNSFATSDVFVCPDNPPVGAPRYYLVMAWGGGGGGGASGAPNTNTTQCTTGGGGGGGALRTIGEVALTPGQTYNITIGAGGSGGASAGAYGADGADTTIANSTTPSTFIFRAYGGGSGTGGALLSYSGTIFQAVRGGPQNVWNRETFYDQIAVADYNVFGLFNSNRVPGTGGVGVSSSGTLLSSARGATSQDALGGAAAVCGTQTGAYYGGGAGGGGGGGNYDSSVSNDAKGGAGGNGGGGANGVVGSAGVAGGTPLANTGAGGGGGGAGGQSNVAGATFKAGGAGASGFLVLIPIH